MDVILSEVSRTIPEAYAYYGFRIVLFTIVAAIGIFLGMKIRKYKNSKEENSKDETGK